MAFEVGQIVEGKVVKITNFGAFIELEGGKNGLIHISEISNSYVKNVSDYLNVGESVKAKIVSIKKDGRIDLSLKQLEEKPQLKMEKGKEDSSFERMLKQYLRASEEKQSDLKRRREARKL